MTNTFRETISSVLTLSDSSLVLMDELFSLREELKRKICKGISDIEQALSVDFNYSVTDSVDSVTITDHYKEKPSNFQHQPKWMIPNDDKVYNYKMTRYQQHGQKVFKFEGDKTIKLRAKSFAFDLPQSNSSIFYLTFDDYFNVVSVVFVSSTKDMGKFSIKKISLQFNQQLKLTHYEYKHESLRERFERTIKKTSDRLMSLDDEIILWQLFSNRSDDIKELIPEYYIPSAYNFKTQEFSDRLNVLSMLIL
jgi:hypothetical protein